MATRQSAALDRKKLLADPIMVSTIVVLITFLSLFILYPLAVLLVDSVYSKETGLTLDIFRRIFDMGTFRTAIKAKCPVVPIAFIDCFKVLDQKGSKPVSVQMHYLKPISYEEYKDLKTVEVAELVKSRIQEVLDANT